uniref:Peptidase S1 domain-containing protein n=1 Tax=Megaselia scalaris TaxID=36166 RepID=T1GFY9_MEGSC
MSAALRSSAGTFVVLKSLDFSVLGDATLPPACGGGDSQRTGGNYKPTENRGPSSSDSDLIPEPGVCGNVITNKIYGGVETRLDEYPWMALIEYQKPGNKKGFHCGGSMISNRYVLTASHCINARSIPADWKPISVRLGEWDTATDRDCDAGECAPPHIDVPIERSLVMKIIILMLRINQMI